MEEENLEAMPFEINVFANPDGILTSPNRSKMNQISKIEEISNSRQKTKSKKKRKLKKI